MTTIRAFAAAALLACTGAADADTFGFSGAGFDGGGSLWGSFRGTDRNGNGLISTLDPGGEVVAFSLHFDGDAVVPAFHAGLGDLVALSWRPSSGPSWGDGVQEGLAVGVPGFLLAGGLSAFGETGAGVVHESTGAMSFTRTSLQVSVVPEPATGALFGLGLAALAGLAAAHARLRRQ
jgi:hypothetical protein